MHGLPNKIGRVKNGGLDGARCDIRVYVHAIPNKIGRVKNAPEYHSARCDIHAIPNKIGRVKNAPA